MTYDVNGYDADANTNSMAIVFTKRTQFVMMSDIYLGTEKPAVRI